MKQISSFFKLTLVLAIFASACKGPAGDTGPAGATGAQGAQGAAGAAGAVGATGPAGPAGKDGKDGTSGASNITTSPWIGITTADWNTFTEDSTYINVYIPDKVITETVLEKGLVYAYIRFGTGTGYAEPMPYGFDGGKISFAPIFDATEGGFMEIYLSSFRNKPTGPNIAVRYVIVPEATVSNPGRQKAINWNDYNEVKRELNLKD